MDIRFILGQMDLGMAQDLVIAAQKHVDMLPWWGMMAPAGTPPAIVARLTQELQAASADQGVRERLKATFVQIEFAGPQEFSRRLDAERAQYGDIIRAARIRQD